MFRRIILALTFVTALGVGGLAMTNTADAWHRCHGGGYGGYGGYYGAYYGGGYGYYPYVIRSSYYPPIYYGTPYYGRGYYGHHHHHDGISFSIGF
jgi:hypothetical protein